VPAMLALRSLTSENLNNIRIFDPEMCNTRQHKYKNTLSKWWIAAVFVLAFFIFSASASRSQVKPGVNQTTVLIGKPCLNTKCITFYRALKDAQTNHCNIPVFFANPALTSTYTLKIKACLKKSHPLRLLKVRTGFFYQNKTIPQNSGDEPAPLSA
jgi:hypothetical protein